jgi:hypothetical protein
MKEFYLDLFELLNDYGAKKLDEIEINEPQHENLIHGHIFLQIKEDRRTKTGKVLSNLVDRNEIYQLSYDEFNGFFRLYFTKIHCLKSYKYVYYAYEAVKNKLDSLSNLNSNIHMNID